MRVFYHGKNINFIKHSKNAPWLRTHVLEAFKGPDVSILIVAILLIFYFHFHSNVFYFVFFLLIDSQNEIKALQIVKRNSWKSVEFIVLPYKYKSIIKMYVHALDFNKCTSNWRSEIMISIINSIQTIFFLPTETTDMIIRRVCLNNIFKLHHRLDWRLCRSENEDVWWNVQKVKETLFKYILY